MTFELLPLFVLPFTLPVILIIKGMRHKQNNIDPSYYTQKIYQVTKSNSSNQFKYHTHNIKCYMSTSDHCECACKGSLHGKGLRIIQEVRT